jgi:hypothetical protein
MKFFCIFLLLINYSFAREVKLEWKAISDESLIEISKNKAFTSTILKKIVDKENFTFNFKKPGIYYWRVTQSWKNKIGKRSPIGEIVITPTKNKAKVNVKKVVDNTVYLKLKIQKPFSICIKDHEGYKYNINQKIVYNIRPKNNIYFAYVYVCTQNKVVKKLRPISIKLEKEKPKFEEIKKASKKSKKIKEETHNQSLSFFYMYTIGRFFDDTKELSLKLNQDSPVTIGASYFREFKDYNLSASIYYSYLESFNAGGEYDDNIYIPSEIGFTNYFVLKEKIGEYDFYAGLDFERFSRFETEKIYRDSSLEISSQYMSFITLGLQRSFKVKSHDFFMRFSLSQSFWGKNESAYTDEPYNGQKILIYLNTPIKYKIAGKELFLHGIYKKHILEGSSDLIIDRYGLGVGFKM